MASTPKPPATAAAKAKPAAAAKPATAKAPAAKPAKSATPKAPAATSSAAKPAAKAAPKAAPKAAAKPAAKVVAKPAAPKAKPVPRAKPAAAAPSPEAQVAAAASALVSVVGNALSIRKKELVERVVAASGAKKKQVKEIAKGEELHLPPFGKAKVNRSKDNDGGTTMMVKLRQGTAPAGGGKSRKGAKQGLAEADD